MVYRCKICGKEFDALWPDLYRYKRGGTFLCSWSCLRKYDEVKGSGDMTLTDKQKREACEKALRGENPLTYLKKIGVKNPTLGWDTCLNWAKKNIGMGYEQLPKRFGQPKKPEPVKAEEIVKKIAEDIVSVTDDGSLVAPKKKEVVFKPSWGVDGYAATAIKKDGIGEFYYDKRSGTIDWRNEFGEEVSLLPADWAKLAEEIPKMLKILGVEV